MRVHADCKRGKPQPREEGIIIRWSCVCITTSADWAAPESRQNADDLQQIFRRPAAAHNNILTCSPN